MCQRSHSIPLLFLLSQRRTTQPAFQAKFKSFLCNLYISSLLDSNSYSKVITSRISSSLGILWDSKHLHLILQKRHIAPEVLFIWLYSVLGGFPGGASGKEPACQCRRHRDMVQFLGQEDPLEESMATHSSILTWRIPWTEEPSRLQSTGLQKSQTQLSD